MKVIAVLSLLCLVGNSLAAGGAGRAYPVDTENFVVDLFRQVNPRIDWDKSNFLVDLSGNYANCDYINSVGFFEVNDRVMPGTRQSIGGIRDNAVGSESHTVAVDNYIRPVMESWTRNPSYRRQIEVASKFACSVRPACSGRVVMACLFTPSSQGPGPNTRTTARPTPRPRTTPRTRPTTPYQRTTPYTFPPFTGDQHAKAFTKEQYQVAEGITNQRWDRSHLLENLSGYETHCKLIGRTSWGFPEAKTIAEQRRFQVRGLFGYERNVGSTPDALEKILNKMKEEAVTRSQSDGADSLRAYFFPRDGQITTAGVGCSVIPDCIYGPRSEMYVVVACVFKV